MNFILAASDCKGTEDCCSTKDKCKDGDGDCDRNTDCISGLCGSNNCDTKRFPSFDSSDDCCMSTIGKLQFFCLTKGGFPRNIFFRIPGPVKKILENYQILIGLLDNNSHTNSDNFQLGQFPILAISNSDYFHF